MKTINELEQEAKQARDSAIEALNFESFNKALFVNRMIEASVAMVTYQFALGMENADQIWNESGTKVISEKLSEVSQEERDSDGWIDWNGGSCPVDENVKVELKFRSFQYKNMIDYAGGFSWYPKDDGTDIIAYRIVKGE